VQDATATSKRTSSARISIETVGPSPCETTGGTCRRRRRRVDRPEGGVSRFEGYGLRATACPPARISSRARHAIAPTVPTAPPPMSGQAWRTAPTPECGCRISGRAGAGACPYTGMWLPEQWAARRGGLPLHQNVVAGTTGGRTRRTAPTPECGCRNNGRADAEVRPYTGMWLPDQWADRRGGLPLHRNVVAGSVGGQARGPAPRVAG